MGHRASITWIALLGVIEFTDILTTAIFLALRWMERGTPGASTLFNFTLWSVRVATVALALVSLHNAVLLTSLQA